MTLSVVIQPPSLCLREAGPLQVTFLGEGVQLHESGVWLAPSWTYECKSVLSQALVSGTHCCHHTHASTKISSLRFSPAHSQVLTGHPLALQTHEAKLNWFSFLPTHSSSLLSMFPIVIMPSFVHVIAPEESVELSWGAFWTQPQGYLLWLLPLA